MQKNILKIITWQNLEELKNIASKVIKIIENQEIKNNIWIWEGDLGAGKTTLIKEICQQKNVIDKVQSPTFSIINEYKTSNNQTIFHIDCYRIQDEEEMYDIGFEEYVFSNHLCLIEWGTKFLELLPSNYFLLQIALDENNHRQLTITQIIN